MSDNVGYSEAHVYEPIPGGGEQFRITTSNGGEDKNDDYYVNDNLGPQQSNELNDVLSSEGENTSKVAKHDYIDILPSEEEEEEEKEMVEDNELGLSII